MLGTSTEKTTRAPAKKKEKVKLDFSQSLDMDKVFAKSSVSINLPKTKTGSEELHLLPPDLQFNSDRLLKLFLKPKFKVLLKKLILDKSGY